jgi:hypothetical protein
MSTNRKLLYLISIFALHSAILFYRGVLIFKGLLHGNYVLIFAEAIFLVYMAFLFKYQKNKCTYWVAIAYAGLLLLRVAIGLAGVIILYTQGISTSTFWLLDVAFNTTVFAIIPFLILLKQDVRNLFLNKTPTS